MNNKNQNKYDKIRRFIKFFNLDDTFNEDLEDDYDFNDEFYKENKLKENVRDKLLTDENIHLKNILLF